MAIPPNRSTALVPAAATLIMPPVPRTSRDDFYHSLDTELAKDARDVAERIRARLNDSYLDTGRDFLLVKGKLKHGAFGKWLAEEFGMTERTAQHYMNAARFADENPKVVSVLAPTMVYKLAAPSTPDVVKQEIAERTERGEYLTLKEVELRIAEVKLDAALKKTETVKPTARKAKLTEETTKLHEGSTASAETAEHSETDRAEAAGEFEKLLQAKLGKDLARFSKLVERLSFDEFRKILADALKAIDDSKAIGGPKKVVRFAPISLLQIAREENARRASRLA